MMVRGQPFVSKYVVPLRTRRTNRPAGSCRHLHDSSRKLRNHTYLQQTTPVTCGIPLKNAREQLKLLLSTLIR